MLCPNALYYSPEQVKRLIKQYQALKSVVQFVAMRYSRSTGRTSNVSGREDILCMLVDIAQAIVILTKRQRQVVLLMIVGCSTREISFALNISTPTVKFHQNQAIDRITTYLNSQ